MRTLPLASIAALWDGLPPGARLLLIAVAAAVVAVLALPLVHWISLQRRIRQLPPPPPKVETGPPLRLPRRDAGDPPAPADTV